MKKIKFELPYCLLALIGAILIALCNHSIAENDINSTIVGVGSLICYSIPLVMLLGIKHINSSINANLKVLSAVFFIILLISNFAFSIYGVVMPYYAICNGLILIINIFLWMKISDVTI